MRFIFIFTFFILLSVGVLLSRGQNYDLHFSRSVPSQLSADRLNRNLSAVTRWPQWCFALDKVRPLLHSSTPAYVITQGDHLLLEMDPHKGAHRRFNLEVEVTQFIPNKILQLTLIHDSSKKLTHLFDSIQWTLEILPNPDQPNQKDKPSIVHGTATAHTRHWKSRLFGKIAERMLMNQVFFPNLVKFVELKQPFSISPGYAEGGLTGPESPQ